MQRLNELNCLEFVKNVIKKEKINGVCKPVSYFVKDIPLIKEIILKDKLQDNESKFPDFKDDNSLIEHFSVSASELINKKSSKLKQIENKFNKEVKKSFNQQVKQHNYNPNTITTLEYEMEQPQWDYKFYVSSFKRSFEHHIMSLKDYNKDISNIKKYNIFLIEYEGAHFSTLLNNGNVDEFYTLSKDKTLLEYIQSFKDILQYVIFTDNNYTEIIELTKINEIISKNNFIDINKCKTGRYLNIKLNLIVDI